MISLTDCYSLQREKEKETRIDNFCLWSEPLEISEESLLFLKENIEKSKEIVDHLFWYEQEYDYRCITKKESYYL